MLLCIVRKRGNQPNSLFQKLGLLPLSFERPGSRSLALMIKRMLWVPIKQPGAKKTTDF